MGPTRDELQDQYGRSVPDLFGDGVKLLLVGINPGLYTAWSGIHFMAPSNRFWPAMVKAGLIDRVPTSEALADGTTRVMAESDRAGLIDRGVGITNLVQRATARADELVPAELVAGGERLAGLVADVRPEVVAIMGIGAYRVAFSRRKSRRGRQDEDLAGAALWILGNPSGLNAHETVDTIAAQLRTVAEEAGVV